jgi:hypothetical protein
MSKTINRIIQLLHALRLSARQFDMSIGTGNGYILRMQKNNASVGSDVIERIIEVYPQVNLIWLITGEGDMFSAEPDSKPKRSKTQIEDFINNRLKSKLSEKKKILLNELLKEIEDLEEGN